MLPPEDFRVVDFAHPHERQQFAFFNGLNHPHFGLVANVDVAGLWAFAKTEHTPFNRLVAHAVASAANAVPALRRRLRAGEVVVEHAAVHPSYAVDVDGAAGFTFCEVAFAPEYAAFAKTAAVAEARVRAAPTLADAPGRDDYLFCSAIPWVHFTGIQHAMNYHPHDSVPRISWGKAVAETSSSVATVPRRLMPVSIHAHHALVDGRGLGAFYEALDVYIAMLSAHEAGHSSSVLRR